MVKVVERYRCEICGTECMSRRLAERCESDPVPTLIHPVTPGDDVFVLERYHGWQASKVKDILVIPSQAVSVNSHVEDGHEYIDRALPVLRSHELLIVMELEHRVSKDSCGYSNTFSPDHVRRTIDSETALDGSTLFIKRHGLTGG